MANNGKYQEYFLETKNFRDKRIEIEGPKTFSDFIEPKFMYYSKAYKSGHGGNYKTLREFSSIKGSDAKSDADSQSMLTRSFFRQIDYYIQLRPHIGIENFEGYFIQKNTIVLSYYKNKSLAYLFKSSNCSKILTNSLKLKLIFGIACSMMHLHANKIIHGNLSPATIWFDDNYEPHITDIARFNRRRSIEQSDLDNSEPNTNTNSLIYSSPEILNHNLKRSKLKKIDVYSFGMLCYAILTNGENNLFERTGCNRNNLPLSFYQQYAQNSTRPPIPEDLHPLLRGIIYHSWNPDPDKRPLFSQIVKALKDEDDLLGDLDESYREYRQRIFTSTDVAPQDKNLFTRHHKRRSSKKRSKSIDHPISPEPKPEGDLIRQVNAAEVDGDAEFERSLFNAKDGKPESIFKIGQWLLYGIGCTKNEELAFKFFEHGVKLNDKPCLFLYAKCLIRGSGVAQDEKRGLALLIQATGIKNIDDPNENKEEWSVPAILFYASLLENSNPQLADKYYKAAISVGKDVSGDIYYEYGKFLERLGKINEALENYLIAAQRGHVKAPNDYAITLLQPADKHRPTPDEISRALSVLQKASDRNEPTACYNLARIYHNGKYGQPVNKAKALVLARKSAKAKHPKGSFLYGFMLLHSPDREKKKNEAKKYLQFAADNNDPVAMVQLAKLYEEEGKMDEAVQYLENASNLDDDYAMYKYAVCLDEGNGVAKDQKKAHELFQKSARRGNKEAQARLTKT